MTRMRRISGFAGSADHHRLATRWLLLAGVAAAASCAPPRAAVRPSAVGPPAIVTRARARSVALPRTLVSEFDPIGALLELRQPLELSERQVGLLLARRRELRDVTRALLTRLDSLNDALGGALDGWLATGRGAEPSLFAVRGRVWLPKVAPNASEVARRLLMCIRLDAREATKDALGLLDDEQRAALDRLHRANGAVAAIHTAAHGAWARDRADTTRTPPACDD